MMDYRTHFAVLQTFRLALGQEVLADAQIAELRDQHVATLDEAPEMALVGSVIDHLFAHASSDGAELALLERAAKLWREGLKLYEGLAKFRSSLELVLNNPGDERAVEVLNSASESFAKLARRVKQQSQQVEALRKEVSKHPHLLTCH